MGQGTSGFVADLDVAADALDADMQLKTVRSRRRERAAAPASRGGCQEQLVDEAMAAHATNVIGSQSSARSRARGSSREARGTPRLRAGTGSRRTSVGSKKLRIRGDRADSRDGVLARSSTRSAQTPRPALARRLITGTVSSRCEQCTCDATIRAVLQLSFPRIFRRAHRPPRRCGAVVRASSSSIGSRRRSVAGAGARWASRPRRSSDGVKTKSRPSSRRRARPSRPRPGRASRAPARRARRARAAAAQRLQQEADDAAVHSATRSATSFRTSAPPRRSSTTRRPATCSGRPTSHEQRLHRQPDQADDGGHVHGRRAGPEQRVAVTRADMQERVGHVPPGRRLVVVSATCCT